VQNENFPVPFRYQHFPDDRDHDAFIRFKHRNHGDIFGCPGIGNEKDKKNSNGDNDEGHLDPFGLLFHIYDYSMKLM
jgi:hypothetical protein